MKTSNPIERLRREPNRKFERVGVFANARSRERTTYRVYGPLLQAGYKSMLPKTFSYTNYLIPSPRLPLDNHFRPCSTISG